MTGQQSPVRHLGSGLARPVTRGRSLPLRASADRCVRAACDPLCVPPRPGGRRGGNEHPSEVRRHFPTSEAAVGAFPEPGILPERRTARPSVPHASPFVPRRPPPPTPQSLAPSRDAGRGLGALRPDLDTTPQAKARARRLPTWCRSCLRDGEHAPLGFGLKLGSGTDVVTLLAERDGGLGGERESALCPGPAFSVFVIVPG